jgi:hypothetical protein
MLRDVFYFGEKPNVHPREKYAVDLADAKRQCVTEHFWVINEHCDYKNFDWDWDFAFLPDEDVWAEEHNNVWPSPYQKDSGTWLCSTNDDALIIYRADVDPVPLKNEIVNNWNIIEFIEKEKFDFKWHPDPTDPPYIYVFGNEWHPGTIMPTVEYRVPGATDRKYVVDQIAHLLPMPMLFNTIYECENFDYSWRPNPTDPPYIYVFGNTQYPASVMPTVEFHVKGATERKYVDSILPKLAPRPDKFTFHENIDPASFDCSWVPDPTSPPYIYVWGNQWNKPEDKASVTYTVEGATEYKYMETKAKRKSCMDNWQVPSYMVKETFDFSWEPNPHDPPYIYQFGTQWQKTGGPRYVVEGATEVKYIDTIKAQVFCYQFTNWLIPRNIDQTKFDFSWHPDDTEEPYIYQFPDQWTRTGGPKFVMDGATQTKYIDAQIAVAKQDKTYWEIPEGLDVSDFDFSWHPDIDHEPLIYQFGTQWQKTGGPKFYAAGVTENSDIKYNELLTVKKLADPSKFTILEDYKIKDFDYTWHPDDTEEPYIYVFGNNQYPAEIMPTIEYRVPGATKVKYIDDVVATLDVDRSNWVVTQPIDESKFDFSWKPNPKDPPYIYRWGNKYISNRYKPTIEYHVPGATEIKYIDDSVEVLPEWDRWEIPDNIDKSSFDFSWRPDPLEPDLIWQFGTQWQKTGGPRYIVEGATEIKYIDVSTAKRLPDKSKFTILIPITDFDYTWHPDDSEEPYIYVFGNQWNEATLEPTIEYHVEGATQRKYITDIVAKAAPYDEGWTNVEDVEEFDYSWRPNPKDPDYIYVFGNKQYDGTIMPTVTLTKGNGTEHKYTSDIVATLAQRPDLFSNTELIKDFDYSWRPNPKDPPYVYQFGTQWAKTNGPIFKVEGALDSKFVSDPIATILPDMTHWVIPDNVDVTKFDFSWHPDMTAPPYIYQFGTLLDEKDGPKYITPGNDGTIVHLERKEIILEELEFPKYHIKTTLEDLINEHEGEIFWAINPEIDYSNFDFKWVPDKQNVYHINAFGSKDNINTQTYFVNGKMWQKGYRDINYIEDKIIDVRTKIDMFYIDKGNIESQERFNKLKEKFGNITKTRYLNSWVDTITRCITKSTTNLCWILNSELDYTDFEFDFYPSPWQMRMVHVFGTQWSHWGTTFMVNKNSFAEDTKYVKIIEHLSNLNFVKRKTAKATNCLYDIYLIDHGNSLPETINGMKYTAVKYDNSYLKTFKTLLNDLPNKKEHYIWVCSSICDYSNFDFSYICDPFAKEQLHVFPSDKQKFGDTFLIDVNKFRSLVDDMIMMEDYEKINYNQHQRVKRLAPPTIITEDDTLTKAIFTDFSFPYAVFKTVDNRDVDVIDTEPISLWTNESKNIVVTSTGGTRIIVPKEAKDYVEEELYDYPYISRSNKLAQSKPLDIVFLSNGEINADENYEHLLKVTKGLRNRVVRVDGVNGRVAAYHAAAEASETPWMFTVFAKLKVNDKFDWGWQPDRLQIPKHYIFYATNPVNGLEYGHQAMIAYNKKITLSNTGVGLDFTLDNAHEVVELNSGIAVYNTDEWTTWRTAFREALKLKADTSDISKQRLETWLSVGEGNYAEYSIRGASEAVKYYDEVDGNFEKLKLSYDWEWLRNKFNGKL